MLSTLRLNVCIALSYHKIFHVVLYLNYLLHITDFQKPSGRNADK